MKSIIQPVKGTRDFYPEQMAIRTWLYGTVRAVAESFGYQEYEAPILESLELYAAKSGEELVKEQSYVFKDRGGSEIALRPELTPSLARMIAQRQDQLTFPVRWWSFGPFWRYERPQKGQDPGVLPVECGYARRRIAGGGCGECRRPGNLLPPRGT